MRTMDMWTERMTVFRKKSAQMQASIRAAKSTGILLLFLGTDVEGISGDGVIQKEDGA